MPEENKFDAVTNTIAQLTQAVNQLKIEHQKENTELKFKVNTLESQINTLTTQIRDQDKQIIELKDNANNAKVMPDVHKTQKENFEKDLSKVKQQLQDQDTQHQKEIETKNMEVSNLQTKLDAARENQISKQPESNNTIQELKIQLTAEKETVEQKLQELEKKLAAEEKMKEEVEKTQDELKTATENLTKTQDELNKSKKEFEKNTKDNKEQIKNLQQAYDQLTTQNNSNKKLIVDLKSKEPEIANLINCIKHIGTPQQKEKSQSDTIINQWNQLKDKVTIAINNLKNKLGENVKGFEAIEQQIEDSKALTCILQKKFAQWEANIAKEKTTLNALEESSTSGNENKELTDTVDFKTVQENGIKVLQSLIELMNSMDIIGDSSDHS